MQGNLHEETRERLGINSAIDFNSFVALSAIEAASPSLRHAHSHKLAGSLYGPFSPARGSPLGDDDVMPLTTALTTEDLHSKSLFYRGYHWIWQQVM